MEIKKNKDFKVKENHRVEGNKEKLIEYYRSVNDGLFKINEENEPESWFSKNSLLISIILFLIMGVVIYFYGNI
tara:strand:+ start:1948 stop:2169 length:222 start_codon:yes stop_codon:yes gene_type:complete